MAGEDDDITVNIDDLDTIAVNVDDNPDLAATPKETVKEAKPAKKERVKPEPEGPSPEEVLAQAQAYAKTQEDGRRAAEATAANERAMREQAQRQASEAQQTAEQLRERANNSELAIIENGIASAQAELEAQENEYTRAAEAGEFAKMAKIQTKISKAAAQLDRLESQKSNFDVSKPVTTEGRVEAQVQPDVREQYLSQFQPAAQSWLRQHLDCLPANVGGDNVKNSKMMQGHYAALAQSIALNTPEYFKVIEEHINPVQTQPEADTTVTSRAAAVQLAGETTKPAPRVQPSAPPSRDTAQTGAPRNVREVRLTKDQQEMAKVSFPHLTEAQAFGLYARNLIELEAEGKIGRVTH